MTNDTLTLIPYTRQSKERVGESAQSSLSLDSQEQFIRDWGARQGYGRIEPAIRDHDLVGDNLDREGIHQLLAAARPGVHFAVHKWDRFARLEHKQETVVQQVMALGSMIFSCTEPSDRFGRGIYGLMAEENKRQLADRQRMVIRTIAERGRQVGDVPWGYRRPHIITSVRSDGTPYEMAHGDFVPDPDVVPYIQELFTRVADGEPINRVARDFYARGIRSHHGAMSTEFCRKVIRRPVYAGWVHFRGDFVRTPDGQRLHNPAYQIIDCDLWERAQRQMAERAITHHPPHEHGRSWLEGSVMHSCGARMYLAHYHGRTRNDGTTQSRFACRYVTHVPHCTPRGGNISAQLAEDYATALLIADLSELYAVDQYLDRVTGGDRAEAVRRQRESLEKQRTESARKYQRAVQAWIADVVPIEMIADLRTQHEAELAAIDSAIAALPPVPSPAEVQAMAGQLADLPTLLTDASATGKAAAIRALGTLVTDDTATYIAYAPNIALWIRTPHQITGRPRARITPKPRS